MNTIFKLPQMSMTMVDGVISSWKKQEGDPVEINEPLLEVETDKMVKELTSPASGYLVKILAHENDIVDVGGELCVISDTKEADVPADEQPAQTAQPAAPAQAPEQPQQPAAAAPAQAQGARKQRISPLAKKIAAAQGLSTQGLVGTGPGGAIVKRDVEKALEQAHSPAPVCVPTAAPCVDDKLIPLRGIRKTIAENMMLSRQNTASLTTVAEVNLTKIAQCRKYVHQSYTAYAITAVSRALAEDRFEMLRSQLLGDTIHIKQEININVSVATGRSLVTPVIRNANQKNLITIGEELKQISARAREQALAPEDLQGGCFTITNSGVFGSLFYTPVINYPQSAILGLGKIMKTPVVVDDQITIAPMMYICLSYDHRLIDGEVGAPFLQRIKYYLEHPEEMLNSSGTN